MNTFFWLVLCTVTVLSVVYNLYVDWCWMRNFIGDWQSQHHTIDGVEDRVRESEQARDTVWLKEYAKDKCDVARRAAEC